MTATVMRAMIASSGKIYSGYTGVTPITTDVAGRPRCWYSATKLLAESGAEVLAHADDIGRQVKVICARFGKHAPINIRSSPRHPVMNEFVGSTDTLLNLLKYLLARISRYFF